MCPVCKNQIEAQIRLGFDGRRPTGEWKHPLECPSCVEDRERRRQEASRKAEKERTLRRLLSDSRIPPRFHKASLDNFITDHKALKDLGKIGYTQAHCKDMRYALESMKQWVAMFASDMSRNMVFLGNPGTGKDHLACSCMLELIRTKLMKCMIISAQRLFMEIKQIYTEKGSEIEYLDKIIDLDLLVINELGLNKTTDWEFEKLNWLLNERVNNLKPFIVISNLTMEGLEDIIGDRLTDRLSEGGNQTINFTWPSFRPSKK